MVGMTHLKLVAISVARTTALTLAIAGCFSTTDGLRAGDAGASSAGMDGGSAKKAVRDGSVMQAHPSGPSGQAGRGAVGSGSGSPASGGTSGSTVNAMAQGMPSALCARGGLCLVVPREVNKLDMLFMIDNSDSMGDKQDKLRAQLPHLIEMLTSGDLNGDGKPDQTAAQDIHLGVVTSDMGLPGVDGITGCTGLGQDGILQHAPQTAVMGCQPSYPPFLTFQTGAGQPMQIAKDFTCISLVGTGGCGFEHQLEAPLKALWPSSDKRITFLADPVSGRGMLGHGDVENAGFIRNDPAQGLSAIAIVVLSDEDDCSSSDTRPFTPVTYLDPNDPIAKQGLNIRCHFNQNALYPAARYVMGFKALRPGNENLVIYAAIAGVPVDLVAPDRLAAVDFSDTTQREGFYKELLSDQRMQERVDDNGTPGDTSDDRIVHSCVASGTAEFNGKADPPIRLVQVARGFGQNGIVQSICQDDYGPAVNAIAARVGSSLGAACLPRKIARATTGLVACDVLWELPPPGAAPASTPTTCNAPAFSFLQARKGGSSMSDQGGQICNVVQLATKAGAVAPTSVGGTVFNDGWYYDDFSDEVAKSCQAGSAQRVAFTENAKPPLGVTVVLDCGQ